MKKLLTILILIVSLCLVGCSNPTPQDPEYDQIKVDEVVDSIDILYSQLSDIDFSDESFIDEIDRIRILYNQLNEVEKDLIINYSDFDGIIKLYNEYLLNKNGGSNDETSKVEVKLGIDLLEKNIEIFKGKKVGLITNPTGVNSQFKSTIDVLYENENIELTALFAPEHGIRGNSQAGGSVGNETDAVTGLTVYSLYGNTKKPTAEMLKNVDVLCIDIQDVGARFYTYIYTMAYAMEACKELNKTFVVFDRPNPIGGKVEGFILQPEHSSFIGLYPIITRHGMTIGELAKLFNKEFNINCDLKVIEMENYNHDLYIDETTVPWINPSPNMPTLDTAIVYTGTGNFEGMNISEGRGTTKPFEFIGAPFINPIKWAEKLNSLGLEGVYFRPIYFTPTFEDYANQLCGGVQVHVTDRDKFSATKVGVAMVYTVKELYPYNAATQSYLKLVTGNDYLFRLNKTMQEIFDILDQDAKKFSETRAKYLIYK